MKNTTMTDPDDLLRRLEDADTEELHGYASVKLGELLGEAAAEIRRLWELDKDRAELANWLVSAQEKATKYKNQRDAAVAALRELVNAHGKVGVSGPGPEMKTAVGWALDKARKIVEGK